MSWALVTGASAGIGACFARQLASRRRNLVLTARRLDRLQQLAKQLREQNSIEVECLSADLQHPQAPQQIYDFVRSRALAIDTLINNAGVGTYGKFAAIDPARELGMVQLNCAAVVHLTRLFVPAMIERRRGEILIVSSTAAFQAVPYMTVYAATKAFDLILAEGLAQELKHFGIRVCALCPGSTESEFDTLAGIPTERTATLETAEQVARVGLDALSSGKHAVISGFWNRAQAEAQRLAPRRLVTTITERMFRPDQRD